MMWQGGLQQLGTDGYRSVESIAHASEDALRAHGDGISSLHSFCKARAGSLSGGKT